MTDVLLHLTAQFIADHAHAMRNDVATLVSAAQLMTDDDVRHDVETVIAMVQRHTERSIALARIEMNPAPALTSAGAGASIAATELLQLAVHRATREGTATEALVLAEVMATSVSTQLPASPFAERLLTDLIHESTGQMRVIADATAVSSLVLQFELGRTKPIIMEYINSLANAAGIRYLIEDEHASIALESVSRNHS